MHRSAVALAAGVALGAVAPAAVADATSGLVAYTIVGDAISAPLTSERGDPTRGRAIVVNRTSGLCLLCHAGPFPEEPLQGTLAPDLRGAGARWTEGQLRLRLVDSRKINPATIMPSYYRTDDLIRVAPSWRERPMLDAQQIEDVIALLRTLRE